MKTYQEINGTSYATSTTSEVINVLEKARRDRTRIILQYGDVSLGDSWGEHYDISGYVGRSTGNVKVPLLVHNSRSMGGESILDDCIVGIWTSAGKKPLYLHPTFSPHPDGPEWCLKFGEYEGDVPSIHDNKLCRHLFPNHNISYPTRYGYTSDLATAKENGWVTFDGCTATLTPKGRDLLSK